MKGPFLSRMLGAMGKQATRVKFIISRDINIEKAPLARSKLDQSADRLTTLGVFTVSRCVLSLLGLC